MSNEVKDGVTEVVENELQDVEQKIDESKIKDVEIPQDSSLEEESKKKSISEHGELVNRVEQTKELAKAKYSEYIEAEESLDRLEEEFLKQENEIIDNSVNVSLDLLNKLGIDSLADEKATIAEIKKDNKEDLILIKTPSKGSVKGLFFGLIGAVATASAALIYGAKVANLPIALPTFLQKSNLDSIASQFSALLNIKGSLAGYGLITLSSLAVGFLIYKIITTLQRAKNIRYVDNIEKNTEDYIANLDYKISKIDALKEHIEHIKSVMQKYDIIIQEQNSKIRRMLFIEQPEDGIESLQKASKLEVEKTILLLDELLKLMNTPVSEDVEISEDSKERLQSANNLINEVIKKLYIVN